MSRLRDYVVLLTELHAEEEDQPTAFRCSAEDGDHAAKQAENAYPGCEIDFVMATASIASAYRAFEGDGPDGI
jgi:hypothetical protein